jgi:hypothetical protein
VTSLARSELIASPFVGAVRTRLPLILDEYRAHYNTHLPTTAAARANSVAPAAHHAALSDGVEADPTA